MKERKIYVVGAAKGYAAPYNCKVVNSLDEANIVLFTGGEDVSPQLYGAEKHPTTGCNLRRDVLEQEEFLRAKIAPNVKLIMGICRGSQFLCVMNGGLLVQNVNNHAMWNTHTIINKDNEKYEITSTHHQMQYPYNLDKDKYDILFWSSPTRGTFHEGDRIEWKEGYVEPEIVLYDTEDKKSLAIQGHPEMMDKDSEVITKINEIIDNLI